MIVFGKPIHRKYTKAFAVAIIFSVIAIIILTLIIIVAAFNIISGLTILIKNKTKEIAILKTLGISNYSIKKSKQSCPLSLKK